MPEEELNKLVEIWDNREYEINQLSLPESPEEHKERKKNENRHKNILEDIFFLEKQFFEDYELNSHERFKEIFLKWLNQFNGKVEFNDDEILNTEKRYAFILARNIIFINREQILSLINEVWNRIKREFLRIESKNSNEPIFKLIFKTEIVLNELNFSIFVPLSDSSHFMEFRHHCLPSETKEKYVIPCIDRLMLPLEASAEELLEIEKESYKNKKNLFIIEDFAGSGTTAFNKIKRIIEKYDFRNVFFCPYIITITAKKKINNLISVANKLNKNFKIISGIIIGDEHSIEGDEGLRPFQEGEKKALRSISKNYFDKYFNDNGYLYLDFNKSNPKQPTPLGFKNGGFAITLYSNCPNNSLPIIWCDLNGWIPLFRRSERYAKRLKND